MKKKKKTTLEKNKKQKIKKMWRNTAAKQKPRGEIL